MLANAAATRGPMDNSVKLLALDRFTTTKKSTRTVHNIAI
jgi:hypothetical protein